MPRMSEGARRPGHAASPGVREDRCGHLRRQHAPVTRRAHDESQSGTSTGAPRLAAGRQEGRQREPYEWPGATVRTLREVDPRDLLHPLHHALWAAWRWIGGLAQQFPTAAQGTRLVPVGEEAIMPEAHEAAGQHMQQEASDKFVGVERHGLDTIALTTVAVGKADPPVTHVEDPVVRDGDAMRIAADIVQDVCRACKGRLGVDDPLFGIELRAQLLEALRGAQGWGALSEGQGAGGACLGQRLAELPAKDRAQGPHGKEEAGIGIDPAPPVGGERTSRDDAVDMEMRPQGLVPGVQDHGAPDLPAEVAVPKLDERLAGGVEQQGQQGPLVGQDEGVEVVGHGKHQVEIGHRQQLGFAVLDPLHLGKCLALRAVAIATGIIRVPLEPTGGTVFGVPTELRRPAGLEIVHHLLMRGRYGMGTAVRRTIEAEDIGDFPRWGAGLAQGCRTLGSRWHAAAWGYSGVGRGGSPQGRRSNGLRIVARCCRVIRRYRVVVSSA